MLQIRSKKCLRYVCLIFSIIYFSPISRKSDCPYNVHIIFIKLFVEICIMPPVSFSNCGRKHWKPSFFSLIFHRSVSNITDFYPLKISLLSIPPQSKHMPTQMQAQEHSRLYTHWDKLLKINVLMPPKGDSKIEQFFMVGWGLGLRGGWWE